MSASQGEQPEFSQYIDDIFGESDEEDNAVGSAPNKGVAPAISYDGAVDDLFESDEEDAAPALAPKKPKPSGGGMSRLASSDRRGDELVGSDEYDSGEEVVRTAEDDAFIDSDDDDDIMAEYRTDKQSFHDERPMEMGSKKHKKRRRDDDDGPAPVRDDNPLAQALTDMKRKKHEAWTDDKKGDLAQEILMLMDRAADEDDELFREGNVPVMKLKALPRIQQLLGIKTLQPTLLEYNLLTALNRWIEPKDRHTLPGLTVRSAVYELLKQLPCQLHHLKRQPALIGKTVMKLLRHESEIPSNKQILNEIIEKWNRLIFNKSSDARSKAHRRALHAGHSSGSGPAPVMKRQGSTDSVSSVASGQYQGFEEILSKNKSAGGSDGFDRVRVPFSSGFQFSVQPVSKVDKKAAKELLRENSGGSKDILMKKMKDIAGSGKKQQFRAVSASLTGKDKA